MSSGYKQPVQPLTFDVWKLELRKDCEGQGKLFAFDAMGDYVLKLLWATGLDPSVKAILAYPSEHKVRLN